MKIKFFILIILASLLVVAISSVICYQYNVFKKNEQNKEILNTYYNQKVEQFEQENKSAQDVDVVFLGDSITDGCDLKTYYPNYNALNRGIGGDTTFGLEKRLKVSAYDVNPKVVVMLIGANNYKTMFENYEDIVKDIQENLPNSKLVLISLTALGKDFGHLNPQLQENNKKIKEIADENNLIYVDMFTPLFDTETQKMFDDLSEDGVHPNDKGYNIISKEINLILSMLLHK